eukprot:2036957-Amphidinium_carterae.1
MHRDRKERACLLSKFQTVSARRVLHMSYGTVFKRLGLPFHSPQLHPTFKHHVLKLEFVVSWECSDVFITQWCAPAFAHTFLPTGTRNWSKCATTLLKFNPVLI